MDSLTLGQHRHELLDPRRSGLRLLSVVDSVKNRETVGAVERFEEAFCSLVLRKRGVEIFGHLGRALRRIGGVPTAILFGAIDLSQSRRLYPFQLDEFKRPRAVLLGPLAGGLTRREADQPEFIVEGVEL